MAIANTDSTSSGFNGVSSTRNLTHTLGASATRIIGTILADGGSTFSATWNGVAMTSVGSKAQGIYTLYVFQLANPATGAQTMTFNWSGSISGRMACAGYSGDDTSLGLTVFATNSSASTTSLTTNLTAITGWTVLCAGNMVASPALTAGSGSTLRVVSADTGSTGFKVGIFDSNANVAGSTSMAVTCTSGEAVALIVSLPVDNGITYTDTSTSVDSAVGDVASTFTDTSSTTDSTSSGWGFLGKSAAPTWTPLPKT